ncbi:MAG: hypothetical protein MUF75_01780 [Bacteroidia bacterium]|nr:hypothetical protein [Bacteroidia bacterium]
MNSIKNSLFGLFVLIGYSVFSQSKLLPPDSSLLIIPNSTFESDSSSPSFNMPVDSFSLRKNLSIVPKDIGDSISSKETKKKTKIFKMQGSITNSYDVGAIPYYLTNEQLPAQLFKSNGEFKLRFNKIPIRADYFYASAPFSLGLNNYYSIKFDAEEYQNIVNEDKLNYAHHLRKTIDSLSAVKNKLSKENSKLSGALDGIKLQTPSIPSLDTLPHAQMALLYPNTTQTTITKQNIKIEQKIDTSFSKLSIEELKKQLEENQNKILSLETKIQSLNEKANIIEYPGKYKGDKSKLTHLPGSGFLNGLKKFEIGMCYPGYSNFLINQVALNGLNVNYVYRNTFYHASIGKTVVNYSLQPLPNSFLNQIQNLSSLFDFRNTQNGKAVAALKAGLGQESSNYIALGALFGKSKSNLNLGFENTNYVMEIDGRYIYKFIHLEASVANSVLNEKSNFPTDNESSPTNFTTKFNKAGHVKVHGTIPASKTKFSFLAKGVDPGFKSYGIGFMRADLLRLEGKLEQPLHSRIRVGIICRLDEDNIRNLYSYKTKLRNLSYTLKTKLIPKILDLSIHYSQITQNSTLQYTNVENKIRTDIASFILNLTPRFRKLISVNTILFNHYILRNNAVNNSLNNFSFSSFNQVKKWKINMMNSFNQSSINDSTSFSNAINNVLDVGYQLSKKVAVNLQAKHAMPFATKQSEYGYACSINANLHKLINLELRIEKLVLGDYMNTLNYDRVADFPFYSYIRLTSNF